MIHIKQKLKNKDRFSVSPRILWALFVMFVTLTAGCKQAGTVGGPSQVFIDPSFTEKKIERLAFVGTYSSVMDDQARNIVNAYLVPFLSSEQDRFFVTNDDQAYSAARKAGKGDLFKKVRDVWMDHHKVDPKQATELCDVLDVDALLFAALSTWEREKADWKSEESSYTRIEMALSIIDPADGRRIWEAHKNLRKEPGGQAVFSEGFKTEASESVAPHSSAITPDPPRYEIVAEEMARILVGSLGRLSR